MKKLFLFALVTFLSLSVNAQTPVGYAIFGAVPDGYTDLTGNVEVSTTITSDGDNLTATDYADNLSAIAFTGKGIGGSYVCQRNVAVSVRFKENQNMTLTNKLAIHVILHRTDENVNSGIELTMMRESWGGNGGRLSYEVANNKISSASGEVVLKYSDYSTKSTYSSYNVGNFVGNPVSFTGAKELFRICAGNGEAFEISQIYIEAEQGAEPKPELVGEHRYYLYRGGELPANVENVLTCYDERNNLTIARNGVAADATQTLFHRENVSQGWFAFDTKMTNTVENQIDDDWYLVIRFRSNLKNEAFGSNNFRVNLSNGAANFKINNLWIEETQTYVAFNDGLWKTVSFKLGDATGTKPSSYLVANQIALQFHLNNNGENGKFLDVDYAYFTNDITNLDPGFCEDNKIVTADNDFYSFYADEEVTVPSDVTVYTGALNGDVLELTELEDGVIPAKTGVLVKTESATGTFICPATSTGAENAGDLKGVSVATLYSALAEDGKTLLELGTVGGVVCFCQPNSSRTELAAHKAYLMIDTPAEGVAPRVMIGAHPMPTGVENAAAMQEATKLFINGQLYIVREGNTYDMVGNIVK